MTSSSSGLTGRRLGVFDVKGLHRASAGWARRTRVGHEARSGHHAQDPPARAGRGQPERMARFQREARTLASLTITTSARSTRTRRGGQRRRPRARTGESRRWPIAWRGGPDSERRGAGDRLADRRGARSAARARHPESTGIFEPANIKLRRDGTVKVLDFDWRKLQAQAAKRATLTAVGTRAGMVMGTPALHEPRRDAAKPVGARAASGRSASCSTIADRRVALQPQSTAETLASVLGTQLDYSRLPSGHTG